MLENLPAALGRALRTSRPGLEHVLYFDPQVAPKLDEIEVFSAAFADGGELPVNFTSDGAKISPPLAWSQPPQSTQSVILVIEDADSPTPSPLVHAIVWDLPASAGSLEAGALRGESNEGEGLAMGRNSCLGSKYLPPDPPPGHGPHRYCFQVFALDHRPDLGANPGRHRVIEHLKGHVLAKGLLIGTYERL